MERQEMVFDYTYSGIEECEMMEYILRSEYGIESEVEYHDEQMILVWYE